MRYSFKKLPLLAIPALMLVGMLVNSCKKENNGSYINTLLTNREWILASVRTELFHGDTSKLRDTLNTDCNLTQKFYFTSDGICTYENFHCIRQAPQGRWQLITTRTANATTVSSNLADSVFLTSTVLCLDTSKAGQSTPFARVRIMNLGENSMVIEHTRLDTVYRNPVVVQRRLVTRYGFIH